MGPALSNEQAEPVLLKAVELGCTFWDTAVAYGAGINESLLGKFIAKHNVRDKLFIASKCGFEVFGPNRSVSNSPEHIQSYIDGTIERLGFAPDLYYLHRIDPETPLDVSIPALDGVRKAGKCKYIGLSEVVPSTHASTLMLTKSSAQRKRCARPIRSLTSTPFKLNTLLSRRSTKPMGSSPRHMILKSLLSRSRH